MKKLFFLSALVATFFAFDFVYGITLSVSSKTVTPGATTCLDITARDFDNIIAAQYSMKWDPEVLKFKKVANYGMPNLGVNNFGTQRSDEGLLTFLWYDPNVQGVRVPNNAVIYQVCFDVVGESGDKTYFRFVDKPTSIEVGDASGTVIPLNALSGTVRVK